VVGVKGAQKQQNMRSNPRLSASSNGNPTTLRLEYSEATLEDIKPGKFDWYWVAVGTFWVAVILIALAVVVVN
jgi:hypothetical protein